MWTRCVRRSARAIVLGSDRPYAEPFDLIADPHPSDAELRAYCHDNPARLLGVAPN
ncbi:hypothetical protein [Allobranchiibius sp. GilTou73]|uniref:hypothetical protein n=1 Tax=Allobranchiibius sp. GilTou73 TaxID=2904523 RepID=UPI001F3D5E0D|nr:hypothetical protein [Allobranchiibius sp. GilTou73]UIJ34373.1 hypothetical protein LVQ62_14835 [Allobranchiibius sp. GilTou73]